MTTSNSSFSSIHKQSTYEDETDHTLCFIAMLSHYLGALIPMVLAVTTVTCSNDELHYSSSKKQYDKLNVTLIQQSYFDSKFKQTELVQINRAENKINSTMNLNLYKANSQLISKKSNENYESTLNRIPQTSTSGTKMSSKFNWLATGKPSKIVQAGNNSKSVQNIPGTIMVIEWLWRDFGTVFAFTSFVVATAIFRSAFMRSRFLVSRVPEACLMIVLGAFVGAIFFAFGLEAPGDHAQGPTVLNSIKSSNVEATSKVTLPILSPNFFFKVLIPPVLLEASYTLYDRSVMINILPILLHAVLGTFFNAIGIGSALYYVAKYGLMGSIERYGEPVTRNYTLDVQDALVYSSIVSGIDAIPVVPIFEENNVNDELFFLLLGESLVNNAVTITMSQYTSKLASSVTFEQDQYGKAVLFLVAVVFGGLSFGMIGGILSALVTRVTHHSPAVEPMALLGIAYMSYLAAELIHFSGYISIMGCGLVQAHYAFKNISHTSYNTIKDLTKIISSTSEAVIFLFLGMVLVSKNHSWHTGFVAWTIGLCLACRFLVVMLLSLVHALFGGRYMAPRDQAILSYCGLRGATCFCLAHMVNPLIVAPRQMFITAILTLIVVTTFVQGGTVKYLIGLFNLSRSENNKTVVQEFHDQVLCTVTRGMQEIIEGPTSILNPFHKLLRKFDKNVLMKLFVRHSKGNNRSNDFEDYAYSYNLALLQRQLHLAINDTIQEKKYSETKPETPSMFTNFIGKIRHRLFPKLRNKDDDKKHSSGDLQIDVLEQLQGNDEQNIMKKNEKPSTNEIIKSRNHLENKVHFLASMEKPAQIKPPKIPPLARTAHHEEHLEVSSDVESGSPPPPPFNPGLQQPSRLAPNFLRVSRQDSIIRNAIDRHIQTDVRGAQGRLRYRSPFSPDSPSDHLPQNAPSPLRHRPTYPVRPNLQVQPTLQNRRVSFNNNHPSVRLHNVLNTTAEMFRNAMLNSSYGRIRNNGRHHHLEANHPRVTHDELSHHLQSVGDELEHVANVVSRCHSALDQLEGNLLHRNNPSNRRKYHSPRQPSISSSSTSSQRETRQDWHNVPARDSPRATRHPGRHHTNHHHHTHTPSPHHHSHNSRSRHPRNSPPRHSRNSPPRHSRNSPPQHSRNSPPRHSRNSPPRRLRNSPPRRSRNSPPRHSRNSPPRRSRYSPPRRSHHSRSPSASTTSDSWQGRPRHYSRSNDPYRRDVTPPPQYRNRGRAEPPANPPRNNRQFGPAFLAQLVHPQDPNLMLNRQMAGVRGAWGQNPNGAFLVPLSQFPQPPRGLRVPSMPPYDNRQIWDNPLQARPARRRPQPARLAQNNLY